MSRIVRFALFVVLAWGFYLYAGVLVSKSDVSFMGVVGLALSASTVLTIATILMLRRCAGQAPAER